MDDLDIEIKIKPHWLHPPKDMSEEATRKVIERALNLKAKKFAQRLREYLLAETKLVWKSKWVK